jgi:tetratricopeptide (TPR) repeat protein
MQVLEKNKKEIEEKALKMSEFLRMEYLENCLKKFTDVEILRYCYAELSRLYERNVMYTESIKYIAKFQEVAISPRDKLQAYVREIELLIKSGSYDRVEYCYNRLFQIVNPKELFEIETKIIALYRGEGEKFEKTNKNSLALKVYEKLLKLVKDSEKLDVKKKLFGLYKKLGKVRESLEIEREIGRS